MPFDSFSNQVESLGEPGYELVGLLDKCAEDTVVLPAPEEKWEGRFPSTVEEFKTISDKFATFREGIQYLQSSLDSIVGQLNLDSCLKKEYLSNEDKELLKDLNVAK